MNKIELLAPAGNLQKLKMAFLYGADAVYAGINNFNLRALSDNFSIDELKTGVEFAHQMNKKVYLTLNILAHNHDINMLQSEIDDICKTGIDAFIVSDPGIISIIKETNPHIDIHLSTQANCTNWKSACFWHDIGVKRIILAREMKFGDIYEINKKKPKELELEAFVHGSMCISYSGRCLLSSVMTGRKSNSGLCAQPCRWKYYLVEEKRPGEYYPVFEDERGTYIMNSKDLCMIHHIPELIDSGLKSIKIEGRMKSTYYVATVVKAYRQAIDSYYENPEEYIPDTYHFEELKKVSHREFTKGFFFGEAQKGEQIFESSSYIRNYDFVGLVLEYDDENKTALVEQRNKVCEGDVIEIVEPHGDFYEAVITGMKDKHNNMIKCAPHPQMEFYISSKKRIAPYSMIRKKSN